MGLECRMMNAVVATEDCISRITCPQAALRYTVQHGDGDPTKAMPGDRNPPTPPPDAGLPDVEATQTFAGSSPATPTRSLPATIGRYHIIRLLGEGGMGAVYEAEQDQPRRRVALKVIKGAFTSSELVRRFELELQTLGRLHHPGIAQVYDAGAAETAFGSQPFFAMELIHGKPLLNYAVHAQLNTRQRLELMIKICEAVQHAHDSSIIHRDLKPANILVEKSGQPKVLDFGLARVTDSDIQATRQTDIGQLLGTLPYMSPEQVTGDPAALDTRSDVYSLGVILYELLAGKLPYRMSRQVHEAVHTIQEVDPAPLSSVSRVYRGDIETMVARALEKDKTRRYSSAAELAADLRLYLDDRPIMAKPASTSYLLRKFARRHKALVGSVAAVILVLVAATVISTWEAIRAKRAAETAEALNNFLQNDLLAQASASSQSGPSTKPDPDLKVRTALDRAAQRITGKFDKQPEVEAAIRDTIGRTYMDLGLYAEAGKQEERALELRRRALGEQDPKTLQTMTQLGHVTHLQGNRKDAEALLSQTVEKMRRALRPEDPDLLTAMYYLGDVYRNEGKYAQAEPIFAQILDVRRRTLGPDHRSTLSAMNGLANAYSEEGKYAQAEPLYKEMFASSQRVLGPEHPTTLTAMNNLALNYYNEGRYSEAEPLFIQALEISRRVLGPEHPDTLMSMQYLAGSYADHGNYAQAEAMYDQTLQIRRRVLGPEHPDTLLSMTNLASVFNSEGKYSQAESLGMQTLEIMRRVLGPEHPDTLWRMSNLANVYSAEGKYAQAEALFRQTLEARRRVLGAEHPNTLFTLADLSSMYQRQGKYQQAETLAEQVVAGRRHNAGNEDADTLTAETDLALTYHSQGKFSQCEPLAREVLEIERKNQPDDWQRFRTESLLGATLAGQKKYAEAEPLLLEGYRGMLARKSQVAVPDWYQLAQVRGWIVQLYQDWGKPARAAEWQKK